MVSKHFNLLPENLQPIDELSKLDTKQQAETAIAKHSHTSTRAAKEILTLYYAHSSGVSSYSLLQACTRCLPLFRGGIDLRSKVYTALSLPQTCRGTGHPSKLLLVPRAST
jgi:hypothetical protein